MGGMDKNGLVLVDFDWFGLVNLLGFSDYLLYDNYRLEISHNGRAQRS